MSLLDTASLVVTPNGTKAGKLYSVVPSSGAGDLDVTRATTATRVNSSGLIESVASNVPRLDYTNGSCPSILVEPQRTNVITYSEDFTNVSWAKADTNVTSNSIVAPDGNTTADKLTPNTSNTLHIATKSSLATTGVKTFSIFAKQGGYKNILVWFDTHSGGVGVNLDTLNVFRNQNLISHEVKQFANGWVYISITANIAILSNPTIYIADNSSTPQLFFSGDGTSGVYLWGAQLEAGSYATSYIPTTSASITRNADVISKTGISSLIGQTEGVIYLDFYYNGEAKDFVPVELYDGSSRIDFYIGNKLLYFELTTGPFLSYTTTLVKGRYKICGSYKLNDFTLYVNGVQVDTESTGTIPTCSSLNINDISFSLGTYKQQIEVNTLALWKTRLTNTQLAQLTTI
jgi:hypothetical protein